MKNQRCYLQRNRKTRNLHSRWTLRESAKLPNKMRRRSHELVLQKQEEIIINRSIKPLKHKVFTIRSTMWSKSWWQRIPNSGRKRWTLSRVILSFHRSSIPKTLLTNTPSHLVWTFLNQLWPRSRRSLSQWAIMEAISIKSFSHQKMEEI